MSANARIRVWSDDDSGVRYRNATAARNETSASPAATMLHHEAADSLFTEPPKLFTVPAGTRRYKNTEAPAPNRFTPK
ncbi:MAG: hypothetical protein Q8P67_07880 [archaeon]|nr:hypothetical protein [archaeon]